MLSSETPGNAGWKPNSLCPLGVPLTPVIEFLNKTRVSCNLGLIYQSMHGGNWVKTTLDLLAWLSLAKGERGGGGGGLDCQCPYGQMLVVSWVSCVGVSVTAGDRGTVK